MRGYCEWRAGTRGTVRIGAPEGLRFVAVSGCIELVCLIARGLNEKGLLRASNGAIVGRSEGKSGLRESFGDRWS